MQKAAIGMINQNAFQDPYQWSGFCCWGVHSLTLPLVVDHGLGLERLDEPVTAVPAMPTQVVRSLLGH